MMNAKLLEELTKSILNLLPSNLTLLKKDLESNVQQCLKKTLTKFDIVTREEFDTQTKVLTETQAKLAKLEKLLAELNNTRSHGE